MAARDSVFQTFVPTTSIAAPAEVRRLGSFSRLDLRDGEAAGYVGNGAKGCVWGGDGEEERGDKSSPATTEELLQRPDSIQHRL